MATNIIVENNLKFVNLCSSIFKYDEENKKDLLSKTDTKLKVVFEDRDGNIYPNGKIVSSKEYVTLYEYKYTKDDNGNIIKCVVTETHNQNSSSTDLDKTSKSMWYDKNGYLVKEEFYTRQGVVYKCNQYWYYGDGKIYKYVSKGTQTITTKIYRSDGQLEFSVNETIKSHARHVKYKATFDNDGNLVYYIDGDQNVKVFIERDFDHNGKVLSLTKRFYKICGSKKSLISTYTETYNPYADYQLASVIKNGFTVEHRTYDLKGELIKMWIKENEREVMRKVSKSVDEETGNVTTDIHEYITYNNNVSITKYTQKVNDPEGKLLSYSQDNSKVTTYTYDDKGRRLTAITKKLIKDEFVVISEITYEYNLDEETDKEIKIRTEVRYDADGNIIKKQIHRNIVSDIEREYDVEYRKYKIPEIQEDNSITENIPDEEDIPNEDTIIENETTTNDIETF